MRYSPSLLNEFVEVPKIAWRRHNWSTYSKTSKYLLKRFAIDILEIH